MNILLIGNYLSGPLKNQNIWQDLAQHLRECGYGVLTTSNKVNKILRLLDVLTTIWHYRKKYNIAQIDVFSGPAFIWAYLSATLLMKIHKPFILTLHGGNLPEFSFHHTRQVHRFLSTAKAVTVPSRYLLERMKPYRQDLLLIPNAIDLSHYPFQKRVSPEPNLIWLRAFHEVYNPKLAVELLHLLRSNFPAARLIMVGPDKGDGSLQRTQQQVAELELRDSMEFSGCILKTDVPVWLNKGDIFINTTNIDNTPISVMEALACGLCVVSTNVGGLPYLLENGRDGLLVPPDDPIAMAAAVQRILSEPGLAERLSRNGRQKVEQFDWAKILPMWEELLNSIGQNA